jgi:hypothetical protein
VKLYQVAIIVKRELLQSDPGKVSSSSVQKKSPGADPLRDFAPKDDSDYVAYLAGRALVKSRRHQTLVREYGQYAGSLRFSVATNVHPRDLTLLRGHDEWLVEAKVVYRGNATNAVRDAIGQLLQYRFFLYPLGSPVRLVGLFTEPVGKAYLDLLASIGIAAVWKASGGWQADASAQTDGLV